MRVLPFCLFTLLLLTACSESAEEEEEFVNWSARNEQYLATVANDSMQQSGWQRFKKYSLDPSTTGKVGDYVYVKVIEQGNSTTKPAYTDSVRVMYQGRLIPSKTYPQGYIFDGTVHGTFSLATGSTAKMKVANTIDGFSTALQHMSVGDYWRVYIPWELGYGTSGSGSTIPGYSVLVFDLALIDTSPAGQVMKPWR
jgi:FKBP-type peptidyl-prolyl cis-trans isomerase FklB